MTTTATVTFTRSDGAELAFVPPRLLERRAGAGRFEVAATLEGSPGYRRARVLAYAEAHGYLDAVGDTPAPPPVRGQYVPTAGGKRVPILARRDADHWYARREHGADGEWHAAPTLAEAILAAVGAAEGDEGVERLAVRLEPRLQP